MTKEGVSPVQQESKDFEGLDSPQGVKVNIFRKQSAAKSRFADAEYINIA